MGPRSVIEQGDGPVQTEKVLDLYEPLLHYCHWSRLTGPYPVKT